MGELEFREVSQQNDVALEAGRRVEPGEMHDLRGDGQKLRIPHAAQPLADLVRVQGSLQTAVLTRLFDDFLDPLLHGKSEFGAEEVGHGPLVAVVPLHGKQGSEDHHRTGMAFRQGRDQVGDRGESAVQVRWIAVQKPEKSHVHGNQPT